MLPEVVDALPACNIRRDCRWFRQEGRAACVRCPQIVTGNPEADERLKEVAGMPEPPSPVAATEQAKASGPGSP